MSRIVPTVSTAERARKAQREADALFSRLRCGARAPNEVPIRVYYPMRFPPGRCPLVLTVPVSPGAGLARMNQLGRDNPGCFVSNGQLVLVGTYQLEQLSHVLVAANNLAREAAKWFGLSAIVIGVHSFRQLLPTL